MTWLILACLTWAVLVAVTGGFDMRPYGFRLRSTEPDRAVYAAALLTIAYAYGFRDEARRTARAIASWTPTAAAAERAALPIVVFMSVATCAVGITHGFLVAGGSDSWGYVSEADLWLAGDLVVDQPIARDVPWPEADWTFAPLAYRPAQRAGAIVPVYPPGLPLLMAGGKAALGACGPFVVTPLLAGLTVWLTYVLGIQLSSVLVGLFAAALLATSPLFLFMTLNPMSDVPVTASFVTALVAASSSWRLRPFWTGAAVSAAVLIRPNLAPVGVVFLAFVLLRAQRSEGESVTRARSRAFLWFLAGSVPLVAVLAVVNAALYGAPWNAGYGAVDNFYAWQYLWRNIAQYSRWLWETETAFVALAAVPLILRPAAPPGRRATLSLATWFAVAVVASYLFYLPFDDWWYLRFLLPALPVVLVMAASGCALLIARTNSDVRRTLALLIVISVLAVRGGAVNRAQLLSHWREGLQYTSAAAFVRERLPANALILTVQHSGSVRYYASRMTLRWDYLAPEWWPRALEALVARGYRPYVLLSGAEEQAIRQRFGLPFSDDGVGTVVATLDGPPRVRIYDPLRQTTAPAASMPVIVPCPCGG